jgi:hypothetical protein
VRQHVAPALQKTGISCSQCIWHHGDKDNLQNKQFLPQDFEDILVFWPTANHKQLHLDKAIRDGQQTTFAHPKDGNRGQTRVDGSMKPLALMRALVRTFEMKGDGLVMDFCMKTGICGRGAMLEGRCFLGVEADESNYKQCLQVWASFLTEHSTPAHGEQQLV